MHIDLPGGKKIPLYNSKEQELALARKSVIKTTQEDHLKTVVLIVSIVLKKLEIRRKQKVAMPFYIKHN